MIRMQRILSIPRPSRLFYHFQARTRPPDIAPATVQEVLACYGLALTRPPRNLPLGRRSRNVVLHTSAGKKVLKRYRAAWQEPAVTYGHSILTQLAALDFPAPRLVLTPAGQSFVNHQGTCYALFDFVAGHNISGSYVRRAEWLALVARAGRTLARFHRQLDGFIPVGRHHLGFRSDEGSRVPPTSWYIEQLEQLRDKPAQVTGRLEGQSGRMLAELQQLDEVLQAAPLPRLVIHGDYAIQNLIFQRDSTVVPLDFELARLEWRLSDLVTSLNRFQRGAAQYDQGSMGHFVAAYQAEWPLGEEEWRYLPLVWRFRRLQKAVTAWSAHVEYPERPGRLQAAHEAVQQADWAANHQAELLALNPDYRPQPARGFLDTHPTHLPHTAT